MWLLLRHPDQMALLRADRSLLRNFIEESLRFDSPVAGLWRTVACPVEMHGVEIPRAGRRSWPATPRPTATRASSTTPSTFDITRPNAQNHVAFGLGAHFCIGAALARAELMSAFDAILDRMDDIALAGPLDDLPHEFSFFLRPMKQLPLTFTKSDIGSDPAFPLSPHGWRSSAMCREAGKPDLTPALAGQ